MHIIANYLPQYHRIPENDIWWGDGFTDWVTAKSAVPLFPGHRQPKIPFDENYYDLSNVEAIRWQANLADKYGIYGFGIYHYWFSSHLKLLEKPAELLRDHKDIHIHYLFIWDNITWARTWSNQKFKQSWTGSSREGNSRTGNGILAELIYGNKEDWKKHFDYLNTFFQDPRYIKINHKPVFAIFNQDNDSETLRHMITYWNELAKQYGFDGIMVIGKKNWRHTNISDYQFCYEPHSSTIQPDHIIMKALLRIREKIDLDKKPLIFDYDRTWQRIIHCAKRSGKKPVFYSGFVDFDDSPRQGINGSIFRGSSPDKFEKYLTELLMISHQQGKEYVFLTAWNEWGEGAYLEPDTDYGYGYLEAVKNAGKKAAGGK